MLVKPAPTATQLEGLGTRLCFIHDFVHGRLIIARCDFIPTPACRLCWLCSQLRLQPDRGTVGNANRTVKQYGFTLNTSKAPCSTPAARVWDTHEFPDPDTEERITPGLNNGFNESSGFMSDASGNPVKRKGNRQLWAILWWLNLLVSKARHCNYLSYITVNST